MTTSTMTTRPLKTQIAWAPVIWILLFHLGALLAFNRAYFSWSAILVCVALHWLTGGIGICMTYHRLLTHRSFSVHPRWLEYVFTAIGCAASEGGRSAGSPIIADITRTPTTKTTSIVPFTADSARRTCFGG